MNPNNLSTRIDKNPHSILDLLKSCCGNFCQKQEIYDGIVALVEENKRLRGQITDRQERDKKAYLKEAAAAVRVGRL